MGKDTKTASIVLLVGTSTAGKSTIIERIKEENLQLPEGERMDWQVDGTDSASVRTSEKMDKILLSLLEEDERFGVIKPSFSSPQEIVKLRNAIFGGSLKEGENTLSLKDEEAYKRDVEAFIAKTPQGVYEREMLDNLHSLVRDKGEELGKKMGQVWQEQIGDFNEFIFRGAIESSRAGKPIILDLVPSGDNLFEKFEEFLEREGFSCPTQVVIVHVDPKELSARMHERNRKALAEGGNPNDVRNGTFPFDQYSDIFTRAKEGDRVVAQVARADFSEAFSSFGRDEVRANGVTITTLEQANALMNKMEFGSEDRVAITARGNVDAVYQHDSDEATTAIAKKIIWGATDKSLTPAAPHPVADIFKEGFRTTLENVTQNNGEIFVEKLGLRKSDQEQSWTARTRSNSSEGKNSNELG